MTPPGEDSNDELALWVLSVELDAPPWAKVSAVTPRAM